ncbi:LamG domain-containing protein [Umezawaea sp. Da 62-37]|uniref:LamG domain-containing protein n=1 Tax=Umezawaea sp. Da 62-37 TaxID=3075927 RepID=UPI0028F6E45C|nr:LamG domain-containing protein [Umezawaea sp. Da 62-37]WNV89365.1 LamG domain-containing protein [Umezawaea sp. Da 62-37]
MHARGFRTLSSACLTALTAASLLAAPAAHAAEPDPTVDGKSCAAEVFTPTGTPTFRFLADSSTVVFEWTGVLADGGHDPAVVSRVLTNHPEGTVAQVTATDALPEGRYAVRVTAGGPPSAWCGFTVDLTSPAAPTVSAGVYLPSGCAPEGCGGVGVTDTFTFSSSADVVEYRWGFTDPPSTVLPAPATGAPASVDWAPTSGGAKTLYVDAVDRAGLPARTVYQFGVVSPANQLSRWFYDGPAETDALGTHDLAVAGVDRDLPGLLRGGLPAVGFDGTATATADHVLDTAASFTVMGWVRLADATADHVVISQQGAHTSAFRLGYRAAQRKWAFDVAESDTAVPVRATAVSDGGAAAGVWTHLTGIYDRTTGTVRLHVNGALQGTTAVAASTFDAAGQLWIARELVDGAASSPWVGELHDIGVWPRPLTASEVSGRTDPNAVSKVGDWDFQEWGGRNAYDSSSFAHDLALTTGVDSNVNGRGRHFDGVGYAESADPVLNTDQSFTVDVWVRLAEAGTARTVLAQRGPSGADPFVLRYDGYRWSAEVPAEDGSTRWRSQSASDAVPGVWTHLTAVHDATAETLVLHVDGAPQPAATGVRGWNSDGVLSVGRGGSGPNWLGDVDDLRIFQAAVPVG